MADPKEWNELRVMWLIGGLVLLIIGIWVALEERDGIGVIGIGLGIGFLLQAVLGRRKNT